MPTLQQMRYLVALADTLHFRRAAEAVNVTQPTLSAQLKELELRLGAQLVERSRTRVLLTDVGSEVVDRARRVLRDVEEIRTLARMSQRPMSETIKLGVVPSVGPYLLPVIVPDLHASHPDLGFYVREAYADPLLEQLESGALDLLFFPLPLDRADLVSEPVFYEPLRVVLPQEHRLATRDEINPGDLNGETLLTLEPGHRLYDQVMRLAKAYGAEISTDIEGTSLDTVRQMVAMGMGISLLPALYIRSEVARERLVVHRPMAAPQPTRLIGMVWRKGSARDDEYRDLVQIIAGILSARAPEVQVVAP
ncbi:MAG: LysR substrate-binding domain-containing protein [Pseudomonadota bacterium]